MKKPGPTLARGRRSYARFAVVFAFAAAGAVGLGYASPVIFSLLYTGLAGIVAGKFPTGIQTYPGGATWLSIVPLALLGGLIGAYLGTIAYQRFHFASDRWDKMESGDKINLFLGILAGLIVASPFMLLFQALHVLSVWIPILTVAIALIFGIGAVHALQSMEDILPWSKFKGRRKRTGIKILDTNVIIDGRIYDVAKAGFLEGQLYVPGFVLDELQYIADEHHSLRRARGRRGLEVLKHMQAEFSLEVRIYDSFAPDDGEPVDSRLVQLAKAIGGDIVTNDFNLNRVATLQEVTVLNLNDLALSLRPNVLPQETLTLTIAREGNQPGQGVGYLEDGTMVVIEHGKAWVGETVEVEVTQVIQTERGKMIFAEVNESASRAARKTQTS